MLSGNSILHVRQGIGTLYSKDCVAGYYNDLTEKVTKDDPNILVPQYQVNSEEKIYFPIGIFQYGLAAYDLFLRTEDPVYEKKLLACADWATENQQEDGGWVTFAFKNKEHPYSAMAQGEAISMLIRAHICTGKDAYLQAAIKAKGFMLKPITEGGTTEYRDEDVLLYEYTAEPIVLNGWIFALWGLYDYCKYVKDKNAESVLNATLEALKKKLPTFDTGYWSKYDGGARVCSPFYHGLHIAQLQVMYDLFDDPIFNEYAEKWAAYQKSFWKPKKAFVKKVWQKVFE